MPARNVEEAIVGHPGGELQCFGVGPDGLRCISKTKNANGLCEKCNADFDQLEGISLLRCSQCPLSNCPKRDMAPQKLCYFELYDEVVRFETKEKVTQVMRRVLKSEYQICKRIERLLTPNEIRDPDSNLLSAYQRISTSIFNDLLAYGKFMGYDVPARSIKMEARKIEFMDSILGNDSKGDPSLDELNKSLSEATKIIDIEKRKVVKKVKEEELNKFRGEDND